MQGSPKETNVQDGGASGEPESAAAGTRVSAAHVPSKRLGQILVEDGVISAHTLEQALVEQQKTGGFIGQILVDRGVAKQSDILMSLVKQCKIPHLSLLDYEISKEVLKLIPQDICLRCSLVPIDKLGRILTVAMVNPLDDLALEEIRAVCPDLRIKPILCDWKHFETVSVRLFGQERADSSQSESAPPPAPPKPEPAPQPSPAAAPAGAADDAAQVAMNEAVSRVIMSAATESQPEQAAPPIASGSAPAPAPEELKQSIQETIADAVQEALASVSLQMKASAAAQMPSPDLGQALREAVRDVLRENETAAVARSNLQDLEMRDQDRNKRLKHSSVKVFAPEKHTLDVLNDPQYREEADQRVLSAMNSDRLLEGYTFEDFYVGTANAFTHKICRAVAEKPGTDYNPLFIYGDVGLGKTHLINATGNAIWKSSPDARIGYVSSSRFATRLGEAMQEHAVNIFRENYCHWEVLILDDIQFLAGRIEAQEEFFHIFNVLQQEGRQIIIAGDKPPDRLGMLEQRLISRFAGGIVVNLKPPEWETRVAILRHHAEQSGVAVDEEILSLVAMRVTGDVRKMLGALRKIQAFAQLENASMSCELAIEILNHLGFNEAA